MYDTSNNVTNDDTNATMIKTMLMTMTTMMIIMTDTHILLITSYILWEKHCNTRCQTWFHFKKFPPSSVSREEHETMIIDICQSDQCQSVKTTASTYLCDSFVIICSRLQRVRFQFVEEPLLVFVMSFVIS